MMGREGRHGDESPIASGEQKVFRRGLVEGKGPSNSTIAKKTIREIEEEKRRIY